MFYYNVSTAKFSAGMLLAFAFSSIGHSEILLPTRIFESSSTTQVDNPATALYDGVTEETFTAKRLNDGNPIITQSLFSDQGLSEDPLAIPGDDSDDGANINGPSIIRVPDWIKPRNRAHEDAEYYMYFAHHRGHYIRMAWAADLEGPWTLYNVSPELSQTDRGVLGMENVGREENPEWAIQLENGINLKGHIASPDVIIDHEKKEINMFFHHGGGKTLVAKSEDGHGLNFNNRIKPVLIGEQYMRIFTWDGNMYGSTGNRFWKSPNDADERPWKTPSKFDFDDVLWENGKGRKFKTHSDEELATNPVYIAYNEANPDNPKDGLSPRHTDIFVVRNTVHVFYSVKGGAPERIIHSSFALNADLEELEMLSSWNEILTPEMPWEGVNFPNDTQAPIDMSKGGRRGGYVKQLRDPDFFQDTDGKMYLAYSGQGEDAIGIASLDMQQEISDTGDRWAASGLKDGPVFAVIDLGSKHSISEITLFPQSNRDYQYRVSISNSATRSFKTIVDRSDNTTAAKSITDSVDDEIGRYLRLEILGAHTYTGNWASIREISIEGTQVTD